MKWVLIQDDTDGVWVLATDGAWMGMASAQQASAATPTYDPRPRLFPTRDAARDYIRGHLVAVLTAPAHSRIRVLRAWTAGIDLNVRQA